MENAESDLVDGIYPPYVHFSFVDEWLDELDRMLPAARRHAVRVGWYLKDSPNAPLLFRRYLIAGFVGQGGQIIEVIDYQGQNMANLGTNKLTDAERQPVEDLKAKLRDRGLVVRPGRYRLSQPEI